MSQRNFRSKTTPLAPELQAKLRVEIRERDIDVVAAEAGLSANTLSNLAAGRGCYESTKLLAKLYLSGRE